MVASCSVCDMQKARALPPAAELHPLPITGGVFVRMHSDLCGPFDDVGYVMVTVEAFSGAIFLHLIPTKHAVETARVLRQLIALFGAPAEWVTDNGPEWSGEFSDVLSENYITPRRTHSYRPQSNGRAERSVQVAKQLLTRLLAEDRQGATIEQLLSGIQLAYNCVQARSRLISRQNPVNPEKASLPAGRGACWAPKPPRVCGGPE